MDPKNKTNIAIIGSRGIPNHYGGFEQITQIISTALVKKNYDVFVSCEKSGNYNYQEYEGVQLFYFPIKPPQSVIYRLFYEILYDVYSLIWASRNVEYVYMLGYSAGFFFFIPRIFGKKLWVDPDGMEWKRNKFNPLIRFLLKLNERLMVYWADEIIADSKEIKNYIDYKYNVNTKFIPYGVTENQIVEWDSEKIYNILKRKIYLNPSYYLVVSRLEPDNNIHIIVEAYLKSETTKPLLVVGNFSSPHYESLVKEIVSNKPENKKIMFTGGIYDRELLNMLRYNCYAYLHGHSVGGTNPSLLEAMIMRNIIIAHKNKFNQEVSGRFALYFDDVNDLKKKINTIEQNFQDYLNFKNEVYIKVKKEYCWDKIIDEYDSLLRGE